jgi:hypothetical protein
MHTVKYIPIRTRKYFRIHLSDFIYLLGKYNYDIAQQNITDNGLAVYSILICYKYEKR